MTILHVFICGKYDEKKDFENDFKDTNGPLNKNVLFLKFYFWKKYYTLFIILFF